MSEKIVVSIKPKYMDLIIKKQKVNEFRNFKPKRGTINWMYVYVTSPISSLKYVLKIEDPVSFPNKVDEIGYGDSNFNLGKSKYKLAYPIVEVYELNSPLNMKKLNETFNFKGPQAYAYLSTYSLLKNHLEQTAQYTKII